TPWPIARIGTSDRAALDGALAQRACVGGRVTAISAGEAEAVRALRFCLARGADRAVHVRRADSLDPAGSAMAVATVLERARIDLVLCGGCSDDGESGQFPVVLAAELGWPLVTGVATLTLEPELGLEAERRLERGDREVVRCSLPAVLAVETALAEPRYVSVRARRSASALPIEQIGCDAQSAALCELTALEMAKPRPRRTDGPDAHLSAMDRLAHLLTGGLQQKRGGIFVEGDPSTVAAEITRFLEERGFIRPRD
ncbi:MAG: electron transfer flavoprotein subunit beta/FixA family protein, partial [Candidatus Binatia bacterium]